MTNSMTKKDAERIMKSDEKLMRKWSWNCLETCLKNVVRETCLMQDTVLKQCLLNDCKGSRDAKNNQEHHELI